MARYAHVKDGTVYRIKDLTVEQIAAIPSHKAHYILPYINVAQPAYDPTTHYAPARLPDVIGVNDVTQAWAAPVAKTAQEISDEKLAKIATIAIELFAAINALYAIAFDMENRVRTQVESKSAIPTTVAGATAYLNGAAALPKLNKAKLREKLAELL